MNQSALIPQLHLAHMYLWLVSDFVIWTMECTDIKIVYGLLIVSSLLSFVYHSYNLYLYICNKTSKQASK